MQMIIVIIKMSSELMGWVALAPLHRRLKSTKLETDDARGIQWGVKGLLSVG